MEVRIARVRVNGIQGKVLHQVLWLGLRQFLVEALPLGEQLKHVSPLAKSTYHPCYIHGTQEPSRATRALGPEWLWVGRERAQCQ